MSLRNLLQKFGAWTTVLKWNEPWCYRVRLKGDIVARLAVALAAGSLATTLLLVLFAINVRPPNPLFAFIGMALLGGLVLMFLVRGESTASGRIRICQEGICRKRMYAGLSAQWAEEMSWPYSQIPQCAIVPAQSIHQTFSLLLLADGSDVEMVGIPSSVDANQLAQFLTSKGVTVRRDVSLPSQFVRPMSFPVSLLTGAMGLVVLLGGIGFYALRVTFFQPGERDAAGRMGRPMAHREPNNDAQEAPQRPAPVHQQPDVAAEPRPGAVQPAAPANTAFPNAAEQPPATTSPAPSAPGFPPRPQFRGLPRGFPPGAQPGVQPGFPPGVPPGLPTGVPPGFPPGTPPGSQPGLPPGSPATAPLNATQKTDMLGGMGGFPFETPSPGQQPIVGFRFGMGSWAGTAAVARLDPLIDHNTPASSDSVVVAREGYVVGGVQVDADELVQAMRIVFVRQRDDATLDKTDFYLSDWIGEPTGRPVKTLGKGTLAVLGVYGRRGLVINALGLLLAETE